MLDDIERKREADALLAEMADANGGTLRPEEIVDAARDEDSPLHAFFEWNDSEAAELYRQDQARALIRSFKIEVRIGTTRVTLPKYVRDPNVSASVQGYIETVRIRTDEDARRDLLLQEFERAGAVLRRARNLADYFGLEGEVGVLIDSITDIRTRFDLGRFQPPEQPNA